MELVALFLFLNSFFILFPMFIVVQILPFLFLNKFLAVLINVLQFISNISEVVTSAIPSSEKFRHLKNHNFFFLRFRNIINLVYFQVSCHFFFENYVSFFTKFYNTSILILPQVKILII